MKTIYNDCFPPGSFKAVNIFGYVFAKKHLAPADVMHEKIHTAQMKDLLYIGFYICYGMEYVFRLLFCLNFKKAYRNVSFEKEAYSNERNWKYLDTRKRFSMWLTR